MAIPIMYDHGKKKQKPEYGNCKMPSRTMYSLCFDNAGQSVAKVTSFGG